MNAALDDPNDGQLTQDKLRVLLAALCARAGLDPSDAELIKFTNNAVFRLRAVPVIVRIAGSATMRARVPKIVQVARWLAGTEVPAVRLLPDLDQPVAVDGHLATFWTEVPAGGPRPTGADLADILRRLHALSPPSFPLPSWRPTEEIRQRLAESEGVDPGDIAYLADCCDQVENDLTQIKYVLPAGPIHGDPFMGNLIAGTHGPVICDFDATCIGPREWDLTPIAVGKLRFDYPDDAHGELVAGYGFDVTTWDGFSTLRHLRELKLVTSVIPILRSNPSIRTQWRHRLQTFKTGDMAAKWSTYR